MSNKMRLFSLMIGIFVSYMQISIVSAAKENTIPTDGIIYDVEGQNIKTIEIIQNEVFYVKLRSNPSTGYNWFITNISSVDANILQTLNTSTYEGMVSSNLHITDSHELGFVGVPGYDYFRFKGLNNGKVNLNFVYKQSWMPNYDKLINLSVHIQ